MNVFKTVPCSLLGRLCRGPPAALAVATRVLPPGPRSGNRSYTFPPVSPAPPGRPLHDRSGQHSTGPGLSPFPTSRHWGRPEQTFPPSSNPDLWGQADANFACFHVFGSQSVTATRSPSPPGILCRRRSGHPHRRVNVAHGEASVTHPGRPGSLQRRNRAPLARDDDSGRCASSHLR